MASAATADDAFREQLTALIPQIRAFSRSLCDNVAEAEDLAQEALAKAWTYRSSYALGTNLKAWAFMIVRNQFYSVKRRSWRSTPLDPALGERTLIFDPNPTAALELNELRLALARLPDDQRMALILVTAGGLSYEEVSEICGAPVGTIKSRVSRARDRLSSIMAEGALPSDDVHPEQALAMIYGEVEEYRVRGCA